MKTSRNFDLDPQIIEIHGKARKIGTHNIDIEEFFSPHYSSFALRSMVFRQRQYARALSQCAKAAAIREDLQREWKRKEAKRIENLIRVEIVGNKERSLLYGEDDGGQLEYIFNRLIDYPSLIDIDDEIIKRAFSQKDLYLELYQNRYSRTPIDWAGLVEKHAGRAGECDSAAGRGDTGP